MKKVIIAMLVIASTITSCKKQAINVPAIESGTTDKLLDPGVSHYYHGHAVTHQSEIPTYMSDQSAILYTDQIDGSPTCYYFDNQQEELDFLIQYPKLKVLIQKIEQAMDLRAYALSIGEEDYVARFGVLSDTYLNFADKYKTRAYYTLYSGMNAKGTGLFIPGPGIGIFPPYMDNNAESFDGNFNTGTVYKGILFGGTSMSFIDTTTTPVNLPATFRNVVSSAI